MTMRFKIALGVAAVMVAALFASPAKAGVSVVSAVLTGAAVPEGAGDPDGKGSFRAEIDPELGDFCYVLSVSAVGKVSRAYVQLASADPNAKPVIRIEVTGAGNDMCLALSPDDLKPILANPANYYVGVDTADKPQGALRGTLTAQ